MDKLSGAGGRTEAFAPKPPQTLWSGFKAVDFSGSGSVQKATLIPPPPLWAV